jgi:trehalose 6-phosphate synthase
MSLISQTPVVSDRPTGPSDPFDSSPDLVRDVFPGARGPDDRGGEPRRSDLVVVANRLPIQRSDGEWINSAGGLVSALAPILEEHGGTWIGWTGEAGGDVIPPSPGHDVDYVTVPLINEEIAQYYLGFSNSTLWPLFHAAIRPSELNNAWWKTYCSVNARYAEAAVEAVNPSGIVWVHDYHLLLVPRMIKRLTSVDTHFFLHIPFPPLEVFARLPWRHELVEGMLGADVVGFQTERSASNFRDAALAFADTTLDGDDLLSDSGRTRVLTAPISVAVTDFERIAAMPSSRHRAHVLRHQLGDPKTVFLGVDRLDYTKGIEARLKALELMLDEYPVVADDVRFVQIAVPSRESIGDYDKTRQAIEHLAGRINGVHASHLQMPVRYVYDTLSREELVSYYLAADVMAVTPLADGMNLVSKEYVASTVDLDGVLLLSEFAGSASELTDALMVNPYDISDMAEQMYKAMTMSQSEKTARMKSLRWVVDRNDLGAWTRRALESRYVSRPTSIGQRATRSMAAS